MQIAAICIKCFHLCQEFIYSACFHVNCEEMHLLIKSFKALWVLCVETETFEMASRLNNGNVNRSCISMWYFYLSVYPHFGILLFSRPPDSLPLFRWIHINTSQNYFKFWMYWSWQTQAHTMCCNLEQKVKVCFTAPCIKIKIVISTHFLPKN